MADALARATEAVRKWLGGYCAKCYSRPRRPEDCLQMTCPITYLVSESNLVDGARAVLEAAGYQQLKAVAKAAEEFLNYVRDPMERPDCTCQWCEARRELEAALAALQRVGKEA